MPTLPSLSQSLCLCFGIMMFCQRGRRRDEQSQWSSANSRLWLMTRGTLPSHWAEFTSSHNHLFPPPKLLSICLLLSSDPLCSYSSYLRETSLLLLAKSIMILIFVALCLQHAFLILLLLYFILDALNLSIFAASGTKRATQNPGTSSTRPTSTR